MSEGMVDLMSLGALLGLSADEPRLGALLEQLGVDAPKLGRGEVDAYVELSERGTYLVFTRSASAAPKEKALIFTNVTAYCTPTSTYQAYKGALPFGIVPSDDADAVRGKMGEPDFTDLDLNLERWTTDGIWMYVQYDGEMESVAEVSLQLPDAE